MSVSYKQKKEADGHLTGVELETVKALEKNIDESLVAHFGDHITIRFASLRGLLPSDLINWRRVLAELKRRYSDWEIEEYRHETDMFSKFPEDLEFTLKNYDNSL